MEEKYQVIPAGKFIPYTLDDLSVVIPQASQYVRRLKWFIPQYIKATPLEVLANTVVVYDPEDLETKAVLDQYLIRGITITPPHSTYKLEAGFNQVKTRLCARIHNDAFFKRSDWAQTLIDRFNQEPSTQLIGALNESGGISKEAIDKLLEWYPSLQSLYDQLIFSEGERASTGAPFLSAHCMIAQSYLFKGLYPLVVEFNQGRMDKEDVLMTLFASVFGAKIISWTNMYSFVDNIGASYGDFDEGVIPPTEQYILSEADRLNYPKAEFKEAHG